MLRPTKMDRFRVVIPQSKREEVLAALHEAGIVQFREITETEVKREVLEDEFYEISSVLGRLEEAQEFLNTKRFETSAKIEVESPEEILESSKALLEELEPQYKELSSKRQEIQEKREDILAQMNAFSSLKEVEVPLNYLQSTERIHITVGRIDEDELDDFLESFQQELSQEAFITSSGTGKTRIVVVACRKDDVSNLRPLLYKFDVESLELPPMEESPREALEKLEKELTDLDEEEKRLDEKIDKLSQEKASKINVLWEFLRIERERQECLPLFGRTDLTLLIEGYSPKKETNAARSAVKEATDNAYIMRTYDPMESDVEETPVKLENPRIAKDFEYVTEMYGLPKYDSTDPSLITAISFSIFFGFCLSDAGYGVMMLALFLSGLPIVKGMFSKSLRHILIVSAGATIVIGALFGSWFGGMLGEQIPIFGPHWIDPVHNPIPFLKLVIFVGVLHLAVGYGLAGGRKDILRRNWKGLIFHDIGKTLITIGLFGLIFCVLGMGLLEFGINYYFPEVGLFEAFNPLTPGPTAVLIFKVIFYSGIILAMLDAILKRKAPMMEKVGGVVDAVYLAIELVSNAASYTRLLALGVATSVIALVINYIGFLFFRAMFPATFSSIFSYIFAIIGVVALVIILVFGHIFNIFINSITGFVHTMRLHYAEFFETFYESGGKEYSPFKLIKEFT